MRDEVPRPERPAVPTPCASKATRSKLAYVVRVARSHDRRRARAVAVPPQARARARGATRGLGRAHRRRLMGVRSRRNLERRHRPDPARRRPRRRGACVGPASRAMVRNWCSSTSRPMRRSSALAAKPASNRWIRWIPVRALRTVHAPSGRFIAARAMDEQHVCEAIPTWSRTCAPLSTEFRACPSGRLLPAPPRPECPPIHALRPGSCSSRARPSGRFLRHRSR